MEKGSGEQAVNAAKQSDLTAWNYTLEDIMGSGLSFVGPFHQENMSISLFQRILFWHRAERWF